MTSPFLRGLGCLALLLGAAGCEPWDINTNGTQYQDLALWSADVLALSDGLYVSLPQARGVARVTPDGQWSAVDLEGSVPSRIVAAPDGETLLIFGSYPVCETDDPKILTVEDCDEEGEELTSASEIAVVRGGALVAQIPVAAHYNALAFTSDGQRAVAYLDFAQSSNLDISGVTNLTEVLVIDLSTGATTPVPVGFAADSILFDADDQRAVVLSRSQVVIVDMTSETYETSVRFPLSLDVDDRVQPEDVALTPDGRYALITVQGGSELYVLDLDAESINIITLAQPPSDMFVDEVADRTVLVYANDARADLLTHSPFDIESVDLEEPTTGISGASSFSLLYNSRADSVHDVYQLDPLTSELEEFRAENPVSSMHMAPSEDYAVAITRPEGGFTDGLEGYYDANWGLEVFDLFGGRSVALVAESQPLGVAFAGDDPSALVLLTGVADLLQVDLTTGASVPVELSDSPMGIGAYGDGGFWITHDAALGLVSFLDPATGELTPVGGFASAGLLPTETPLPTRDQD